MRSLIVLLSVACGACVMSEQTRQRLTQEANQTVDSLHDAAAKADETRYFSLFAADGVFLGTDATERWSVAEFQAYAHPHFEKGTGWTYTVKSRNLQLHEEGSVAWFDEVLDNAKLGECRGSGVLRREGSDWRIVQYNLTIPIPNDLAEEVVARIRALD